MHVCIAVSCYDVINYCKMAEEKSPILGRTSLERRHKISQDIEQKKKENSNSSKSTGIAFTTSTANG